MPTSEDIVIVNLPSTTTKFATYIALDIDHTLVRPANGSLFYQGSSSSEWIWTYSSIHEIILQWHKEGHKIILFTNQQRYHKNTDTQRRIAEVCQTLNATAFVGTTPETVKPNPKLMEMFQKTFAASPSQIRLFVGDAAQGAPGVTDPMFMQKDSDFSFAKSFGIPFDTPDNVFGKKKNDDDVLFKNKTVVILVGCMGSGKSTWAIKKQEQTTMTTAILSQDDLGSEPKLLKALRIELARNTEWIVVDRTNGTVAKREMIISIAKQNGYNAVIAWIAKPGEAYNRLREGKERVPSVAYNVFYKRFESPSSIADKVPVIRID
jgi:DNA 3'-phosphatase